MLRLFGGVLILGGGMLLRGTLLSASRRELQTQYELCEALMLLEKEITFTLTPLPKLLLRKDFGTCAGAFFTAVSGELCLGKTLAQSWFDCAQALSLPPRIKERFARLGANLGGDENGVRRTLQLMAEELSGSIGTQERAQRERERLTTVLCLSASLILVLVLL